MELQQLKSEIYALAEKHGASNELLNKLADCRTKRKVNKFVFRHGRWLVCRLPIPELQRMTPMLFEKPDWWVRVAIARNPTCPVDLLAKLSDDKDKEVRRDVAWRTDCPADALAKLSDDKDKWVREAVARNPNCPSDTLTKLAEDTDEYVRFYARNNPNYKTT